MRGCSGQYCSQREYSAKAVNGFEFHVEVSKIYGGAPGLWARERKGT